MPSLTIRDILAFQIGNRAAIQRVVATRWSILAGLILVGTAGLARNYDQISLFHHPARLAGPFIASLITSFFVFCVAHAALRLGKQTDAPGFSNQYGSFLGAFVLTAPIAWLYALPVEHWLDPLGAARVNLILLGIVSLWRVLLVIRVFQVVTTLPFWICLLVLLFPISVEVFLAGLAFEFLHLDIAAGMSGIYMARSQVDQLMDSVYGWVVGIAFLALPASLIAIILIGRFCNLARQVFPAPTPCSKAPRAVLAVCALSLLAWSLISIAPQGKEYRFFTLDGLVRQASYPEAFDYLEQVGPDAFPPSRPLPPDPWNSTAYFRVPKLVSKLDRNRPTWIYETYFGHSLIVVQRLGRARYEMEYFAQMAEAMERLPGGPEFLRTHQDDWLRVLRIMEEASSSNNRHDQALAAVLERVGIDTRPID